MTEKLNNRRIDGLCAFGRWAILPLLFSTTAIPAIAQTAPPPTTPSPAVSPAPKSGAPSSSAPATDDIIVTAQFRAQNVQRTPLAITAISGTMLEARSQTNIALVANEAPNVTLKPQGAGFGPSLAASIRGIGQSDFNPALEPGVGVYVDDVYYATITGSIFDLLDVDRIEILRGPQGTLAGKNSIGGAVKLYSKKPDGDEGGYITATYGSGNRVDLRGSADVKITDNLFARIAGVEKRQDGYINRLDYGCVNPNSGIPATRSPTQGCLIDKEGEVNYQGLRGMLRWQPTNQLEINFAGDYTHEDHTVAGSVLRYAKNLSPNESQYPGIPYDNRFICGPFCNYATFSNPGTTFQFGPLALPVTATNEPPRLTYNGYGFSGTIDYKLSGDLALKSITAYRNYATDFSNDDDLSPLQVTLGNAYLTFHSFSQELRLNGTIGDAKQIHYTVGGFYLSDKSLNNNYQDFREISIPFQVQSNDPVVAHSKAAFVQASWQATDQLTLNGGLRYTSEDKSYGYYRRNQDGTPNPFFASLDGLSGRYSGNHIDYRANVQYQWTPGIMTYFETSTGIKGGGVNPRPFNAAQVQPFGAEKLTSYEIGLKSDLFDRVLRINANGFYGLYRDIQLTLLSCPQFGGPGPCALPANAGDAHIKGFELETTVRPTRALSIDGALSYLDFNYTRIDAAAGGVGGVQPGMVTPYSPKWKWSFGAQYEIDLDKHGTLTPRVDGSYQSHIYANAVNEVTNFIPGYALFNARLTYHNAKKDWEIAVEVTNFTNKYYYLTAFDVYDTGGEANAQPGRPREWALTVRRSF